MNQRMWDDRADSWDDGGASGLGQVVDAVLAAADHRGGGQVLDLGCGTGQLSIPLAEAGADVTAVDISPLMIEKLAAKAETAGIRNLKGVVVSMEELDVPPQSLDLVVSNYALHHLRDDEKVALLEKAHRWLRPGGKLVVGDMMFGRGASSRDREIIASKMMVFLRRGPSGWWRILKNVGRFGLRVGERPVSIETWRSYFDSAGFADVTVVPVIAEAAVVAGVKK
jgi:ubiquinone/menaquinone biosynthesis C-methylase UbiE